jgi:hypothetical protein
VEGRYTTTEPSHTPHRPTLPQLAHRSVAHSRRHRHNLPSPTISFQIRRLSPPHHHPCCLVSFQAHSVSLSKSLPHNYFVGADFVAQQVEEREDEKSERERTGSDTSSRWAFVSVRVVGLGRSELVLELDSFFSSFFFWFEFSLLELGWVID